MGIKQNPVNFCFFACFFRTCIACKLNEIGFFESVSIKKVKKNAILCIDKGC